MDLITIRATLERQPPCVIRVFHQFQRHPTERNEAYAVGYITARKEAGLTSRDDYSLLLTLTGQIRSSADLAEVKSIIEELRS